MSHIIWDKKLLQFFELSTHINTCRECCVLLLSIIYHYFTFIDMYSVILCSYSCSLTQNYRIIQTAQVTSWCLSHDILYSIIELLDSSFYILFVFIFLIIATQSDCLCFLSSWKRSITRWCGIGHANNLRWTLISILNFPPRHNKPHTRSPNAPNHPTGNKSCRQIHNKCSSNENMQKQVQYLKFMCTHTLSYITSKYWLFIHLCVSVCACVAILHGTWPKATQLFVQNTST